MSEKFTPDLPGRHDPEEKVRLEIPGDLGRLPDVMQFVQNFSSRAQFDPTLDHHLQLIVEELVVNAISHGESAVSDTINIELSIQENEAVIDILSVGDPFDPTQHPIPDLDLPLEERPVGGLGVYLTQTLSDSIVYSHESGKNRIVVRKRCNVSP